MGNNIDVVDYNYVKAMVDQPEKCLVDVRNPDELQEAGKIPHSINIPCEYKEVKSYAVEKYHTKNERRRRFNYSLHHL